MLEPTQYRLNGSGPERSLSNGAGLGSEWRTVLRGPRTPAGASPGTGGQFPETRGNRSEQALITPPDAPDPALPTTPAGRSQIGNSTDKVKNDLNHNQPHDSREGKQSRQTRSDHGGPPINPCFLKQILRMPRNDTHFMADLRVSSRVSSQSAMGQQQSQALAWGFRP